MSELNSQYIEDHRIMINTYDSFARALVDGVLKAAKQQLAKTSAEKVEFKVDVKVAPVTTRGCVAVEICVPIFGCHIIHVPIPFPATS